MSGTRSSGPARGRLAAAFSRTAAVFYSHRPLLAIIALGALIRLVGLGDRAFWGDELFALRAARQSLDDLFFPQMIDNGTQIGFYVVGHLWVTIFPWASAPIDESVMRTLPLLFSVATIPVFYLIAARVARLLQLSTLATGVLPLLSATLLAVSPFAVRYAQEFRTYSLQLFLLSLATLLLLHAASTGLRRGWWIVFGLLAAAAVYAHMLSSILLAVQVGALFLVALAGRRWSLALDLVKASMLSAIAIVPLTVTLLQYGSSPMSWVPPLSLPGVVETLSHFGAVPPGFETATNLEGVANMPNGPISAERVLLLIVTLFPLAVGVALLIARRRLSPVLLALLVAPILLVPLAFAASSLIAAKIWWTRYMQMLLIPIIATSAYGILEIIRYAQHRYRGGRPVAATLAGLLLVAGSLTATAGLVSVLDRRTGPDWNISHRAALNEARARWEANPSERYAFSIEIRCYCGEEGRGPFLVRVDGDTTQVSRGGVELGEAERARIPLNADALFDFIELRLDHVEREGIEPGVEGFRAAYHAESGLPKTVWARELPGAAEDAPRGFNLSGFSLTGFYLDGTEIATP